MSDPVKILEDEYARLVYHPDTKIVHHTFFQPIHGDAFRAVLNAGAQALKENKASKWLSDSRKNSVLTEEDSRWSRTDWFPRAVSAGWKYWALVVPEEMVARLNIKQIVDAYLDQGLQVKVFSKPEKAMEWLISCDQPPIETTL